MSIGSPENKDVASVNSSSIRRTFLKRASAGAVIASIPGKSAWATIQGSIVASGQGSDASNINCLQVYSPGYWKNKGSAYSSGDFNTIFGGDPLAIDGALIATYSGTHSLLHILNNPGGNGSVSSHKRGGPANVNVFLVSTYLNAKYSGQAVTGSPTKINFPAAGGLGTPYSSADAMAKALYLEAKQSAWKAKTVGELLSSIVDLYHIDSDHENTGNPAGLQACKV